MAFMVTQPAMSRRVVDRVDEHGATQIIDPISIQTIEAGDRIYLLLLKKDLKKLEKNLGS